MHELEEELRAKVALLPGCARAAAAAGDPRLKFAWIGAVVRLMNASAATGSVIAALERAPPRAAGLLPPVSLRAPKLSPLPNAEGGPPSPIFCKTTSGGFG